MHILWEKVVSTVLLLAPLHKEKMEHKISNVNLKSEQAGKQKREKEEGSRTYRLFLKKIVY
jgi:type III secretory pathway component EscR